MIGDAIQEIYLSNNTGWNQDYVYFVSSGYPFLTRGGNYNNNTKAGSKMAKFRDYKRIQKEVNKKVLLHIWTL